MEDEVKDRRSLSENAEMITYPHAKDKQDGNKKDVENTVRTKSRGGYDIHDARDIHCKSYAKLARHAVPRTARIFADRHNPTKRK